MAGYSRDQFGSAWEDVDHNGCDTRDDILRRDLRRVVYRAGHERLRRRLGRARRPLHRDQHHATCAAARGSISTTWSPSATPGGRARRAGPRRKRLALANDPLNLLAVTASANRAEGRCRHGCLAAREQGVPLRVRRAQVAVKLKYGLWATRAERGAHAARTHQLPDAAPPRSRQPSGQPRHHAAIRPRHPHRRRRAPATTAERHDDQHRAAQQPHPAASHHDAGTGGGSATRTRVSRASPVGTEPSFSATTACGVSRAASRGRAPATAA